MILIDIIIDRDMTTAFIRIDFARPNLMERVQSSITDCGRFDETLIKKSSQLQDFPFVSTQVEKSDVRPYKNLDKILPSCMII
jgi:hypothetical protein